MLKSLLIVAASIVALSLQGCAVWEQLARDPRDAPWDPKPGQGQLFDQIPNWDQRPGR